MSKTLKIEEAQTKVDPKLRVIANGDTAVNTIRAEHASSVRVFDDATLSPPARTIEVALTNVEEMTAEELDTDKLKERPNVEVSVFIRLRESGRPDVPNVTAQSEDLLTAEVRVDEIQKVRGMSEVAFVELGETLSAPTPEISGHRPKPPEASDRAMGNHQLHGNGAGVLIGLIDVQGFDYSHLDFLRNGHTRFEYIWDQGGSGRPPPAENPERASAPFKYGAELTKKDFDSAIDGSNRARLPAWLLEPQSQRVPGSHGTHVASIAAGNRGVCSNAHIAGVLLALDSDSRDRRSSFYDSTRIAHAIDYLLSVASELGGEGEPLPVSINISLGTNGHAHDASSAVSRWIDYALATPGRSVCVAAGNSGQAVPEAPGDLGFVMGRIHASGQFTATDLREELEWQVVGNGRADVSENELEIWYSSQDRFSIELKPPGGDWIGPISPGQYVQNYQLPEMSTFVSIYNDLYYPANGENRIGIYLSPFFSETAIVGVPSGTWLVRIRADQVRDGRFHAWIERDDPRRVGMIGPLEAWRFPSFFSEDSSVDDSTVSSLACGQRIISVANHNEGLRRIHKTSSEGPTRDGRYKPDIAAPGTDIVAAKGFSSSSPTDRWISMSGTSMASPYVTGVVGLMLAVYPRLTAAQIGGIIRRTAQPLAGRDFNWQKDSGYGLIDGDRCLEETVAFKILEEKGEAPS